MNQKTIGNSLVRHDGKVSESDLNGYGIMHGGRLLTLCDEIGYLAAKKHGECDCLTRAAHDIQFFSGMKKNALFSIEAKVVLTGETTMWVACRVQQQKQTVMSAVFVYIAVNIAADGKQFAAIPVTEVMAVDKQERAEQESMHRLRNRVTEGL